MLLVVGSTRHCKGLLGPFLWPTHKKNTSFTVAVTLIGTLLNCAAEVLNPITYHDKEIVCIDPACAFHIYMQKLHDHVVNTRQHSGPYT